MEGRHHQAVREAKDRASETQCVTGHWCVTICALGLHLFFVISHPQSLTCILESWQLFKNLNNLRILRERQQLQTYKHTCTHKCQKSLVCKAKRIGQKMRIMTRMEQILVHQNPGSTLKVCDKVAFPTSETNFLLCAFIIQKKNHMEQWLVDREAFKTNRVSFTQSWEAESRASTLPLLQMRKLSFQVVKATKPSLGFCSHEFL